MNWVSTTTTVGWVKQSLKTIYQYRLSVALNFPFETSVLPHQPPVSHYPIFLWINQKPESSTQRLIRIKLPMPFPWSVSVRLACDGRKLKTG